MAKFLYLYSGGEMADTPEAQEEQMQAWTAWFGSLGDSVVDMGKSLRRGHHSDQWWFKGWRNFQARRLLDHQRRVSR
jgi:hypothetical protein